MSRGGKRPGAGRPAAPAGEKRVPLTVYVSPKVKSMALEMSGEGAKLGRLFETFINDVYERSTDELCAYLRPASCGGGH